MSKREPLTPELRFTLLAVRAQIEALLLLDDAGQAEEVTECQHPKESRTNTGGMGHPDSFTCRACGKSV